MQEIIMKGMMRKSPTRLEGMETKILIKFPTDFETVSDPP